MKIKFFLMELRGRSNPHVHGNAAWYFDDGFMNHIAYLPVRQAGLTARFDLFIQQFLPICSPYGTAQNQNESRLIGRAAPGHLIRKTSGPLYGNPVVKNATRLSSGHGYAYRRAVRYTIWVDQEITVIFQRAVRYAIWVEKMIPRFIPRAARYAIWVEKMITRFIQRAVRYAIWVEKIIPRIGQRAVRYAIWVEKMIPRFIPRAARYAIWNSTSRIENYIAYLFRANTQPTIRIQPITNHHGKHLHPNPHSNRFRGSGQS